MEQQLTQVSSNYYEHFLFIFFKERYKFLQDGSTFQQQANLNALHQKSEELKAGMLIPSSTCFAIKIHSLSSSLFSPASFYHVKRWLLAVNPGVGPSALKVMK